jgi:copper resistance protein D
VGSSMLLIVSVWVHVVAAMVWIGGMMFLSLVLVPALREVDPSSLRGDFMRTVARQFQVVAWASVLVLLGTGLTNLILLNQWPSPETSFGRLLIVKLVAVTLVLSLTALHAVSVAKWIPRAALVLGLVVVLCAVSLARLGI